MDPYGKEELLSFYDRHVKDFGDHPQAVRWTPERQLRRYEALLEVSENPTGKHVLDFGCGKGDLCGFLRDRGISVQYSGLDVNESLIYLARKKYPEAEFIAMDIEESAFNREFDVLFICGAFNLRIAGIEESMKSILKKLITICKGDLYLNVLSYKTAHRDVELFYVKPEELL